MPRCADEDDVSVGVGSPAPWTARAYMSHVARTASAAAGIREPSPGSELAPCEWALSE